MFKADLKLKLQNIFGVNKVNFDAPGESVEQETLFIEIEKSMNSIKDGRVTAMIYGNAILAGPSDKIPFGYLSKRIKQAAEADTNNLCFFQLETNTRIFQNLIQLGFSFVYFFYSQYDPELGTITSVNTNIEVD